jgi:xanthine phosphoribosyltransferase
VKQYYSYESFKNDTNRLITKAIEYQPEAILGIARGGLTLSHAVAEGLNIREVQTLRTELYDTTCKRDSLTLFGNCSFKNVQRVLVLDDIADSGETLQHIMEYLQNEFSEVEFISATLFYKKTSCYEPHIWINEATSWIEFFWEKDYLRDSSIIS